MKTGDGEKVGGLAGFKDRLVSFAEAGRFLGFSAKTVRRMVEKGILPKPIRIGTHWRLSESDIVEWVRRAQSGGIQPGQGV